MHVYAMTHPDLDGPLVFESDVPRETKHLVAWATVHILRKFNHMADRSLWSIEASVEEAVTA